MNQARIVRHRPATPFWRRLSIAALLAILIGAAVVAGGTWLIEFRVGRELERLGGRLQPDLRLDWGDVRFDPLRWETMVADVTLLDGEGGVRMGIDSLVVRQWSRKGADTRIRMMARGLKVDAEAFGDGILGMAGRLLIGSDGGSGGGAGGLGSGAQGGETKSHLGLSLHHSTLTKRLDLESLTLERAGRMDAGSDARAHDGGRLELSIQLDSVTSIVASDSVPLLDRLRQSVFVRATIRLDGFDPVGAYAERRALEDGTPPREVRASAMRLVRMAAFLTGLRDRDAMDAIEAFVLEGAPIGMEIESRTPMTWDGLMRRFDENVFSVFDALSFRMIKDPPS